MLVATGLLSVLYVALAIRFGLRIGSSDLNASARGFFVSALSATIVLYSIAVIQAVVQRNRAGALTDLGNFRSDVNLDGLINSGDSIIVRKNSGTGLAPAPAGDPITK